jgi:hypothetical protein
MMKIKMTGKKHDHDEINTINIFVVLSSSQLPTLTLHGEGE